MDYLLETLEDTFVALFDRIDADTRSGVEVDLDVYKRQTMCMFHIINKLNRNGVLLVREPQK